MKNNLKPTLCISSVARLNPETLMEAVPNLEGVVFDFDRTLISQHEMVIPYENVEALIAYSALGLRLGIISNANSARRASRVRNLAVYASDFLDEPIEVVTSFDVGKKKKLGRPIFDRMAEVLDIPNDRLCFVGDQLLKDVLGANRAEYGASVLVTPYGRGDDPRVRFIQRPFEAAIRPLLGLPLRAKDYKVTSIN